MKISIITIVVLLILFFGLILGARIWQLQIQHQQQTIKNAPADVQRFLR